MFCVPTTVPSGSSGMTDRTQESTLLTVTDVENMAFVLNWIFSSVQSLSRVQLFATPWTAARQASLSITNSQSLLKFMSIELVIPSNHLILWISKNLILEPEFWAK